MDKVKETQYEKELLEHGWIISSSTSTGTSYSRPIPKDLSDSMKRASAMASILFIGSKSKNINNNKD